MYLGEKERGRSGGGRNEILSMCCKDNQFRTSIVGPFLVFFATPFRG